MPTARLFIYRLQPEKASSRFRSLPNRFAIQYSVPCVTTLTGAIATVAAIRALREEELQVRSLQDYHAQAASK